MNRYAECRRAGCNDCLEKKGVLLSVLERCVCKQL